MWLRHVLVQYLRITMTSLSASKMAASSKAEATYLRHGDVDGSVFEPLPADKASKFVRGDVRDPAVEEMRKENERLKRQIANEDCLHEEQKRWFKTKLLEHEDCKKQLEKQLSECQTQLAAFTDSLQIAANDVFLSKRKLGQGSYGDVILGTWKSLPVAVKRFHQTLQSSHNKKLFMQELSISSRARHPNIVLVCGTTITEGNPVQIVMELLESSMSELFDAAHQVGYLTCREQVDLAEGTCCGIAYLHQMKPKPCLHCDIRPSNVLISRGMVAKVGDLGAAHVVGASTSAGGLSANYLAPERLEGGGRSTMASDVYSLGVTVAEIFSGEGAFREQRYQQLNVIHDSSLRQICYKSMEEEPEERVSAQDLLVLIQQQKPEGKYTSCPPRRTVLGKVEQDKVTLGLYLPSHAVIPFAGYGSGAMEKPTEGNVAEMKENSSGKAVNDIRKERPASVSKPLDRKQNGHAKQNDSSVDIPVHLRGGLEEKELIEQQKQVLAEAALKKKDYSRSSGNPVGSAGNFEGQQQGSSYAQRQQEAILANAKGGSRGAAGLSDVQQRKPGSINPSRAVINRPPSLSDSSQSHHHRASSSKGSAVGKQPSEDSYDLSLEIGSAVQVKTERGVIQYGTMRWIGHLHDVKSAGVEMDDRCRQGTDGSLNGVRYFHCQEGYGWFCPLSRCKKDQRFVDTSPIGERFADSDMSATMRLDAAQLKGKVGGFGPQPGDFIVGESTHAHRLSPDSVGEWKGIQGYHNSSNLDATLFSMFYTTYVFDSIFNRIEARGLNQEIYKELSHVLKHGIVNPLRKHSFVRADLVMNLREKLEKLGSITGLTHQEKDPEEFLNALLQELFKVPYYLRLKSGDNVQEMYYYQLFVTKERSTMAIPTVQHLVEQSFLMSDLKFEDAPTVFLVQMPHFGKSFKMFEKIIPSPKLRITDLLENCDRNCVLCDQLAVAECRSCSKDLLIPRTTYIVSLCKKCDIAVHSRPDRKEHNSRAMQKSPAAYENEELELFAVICKDTSHYVSFVKFEDGNWCFFDSMADRIGGEDGYNVPRVVKCDDLNDWLQNPEKVRDKEKVITDPIRRLFSDAYMCMYTLHVAPGERYTEIEV